MKNTITAFFILITLLSSGSAFSTQLSVDMVAGGEVDSSLVLSSGSTFDINVLVDEAVDFAGFEFGLGFDSAFLTATSITSGDIFGLDTFLVDDTISEGSVLFSEITWADVGLDINSSTVLATISFAVKSEGASDVLLTNILLSDSLGFDISPVTVANGAVSAVPAPAAFWLFFSGLVGVISLRKK